MSYVPPKHVLPQLEWWHAANVRKLIGHIQDRVRLWGHSRIKVHSLSPVRHCFFHFLRSLCSLRWGWRSFFLFLRALLTPRVNLQLSCRLKSVVTIKTIFVEVFHIAINCRVTRLWRKNNDFGWITWTRTCRLLTSLNESNKAPALPSRLKGTIKSSASSHPKRASAGKWSNL